MSGHRRRPGFAIVAVVLAALTSGVAPAYAAGPSPRDAGAGNPSPWYQSGWNQSRTGSNPLEASLTSQVAGQLHERWARATPAPCCDSRHSTSVVSVDGTAYFAGADGDVHAVDAVTGAPRWSRSVGCTSASAGPALHLGVLLVPDQECTPDDYDSHLTGFDAATGRVLWRHTSVAFMTAPLTYGGLAYVQSNSPAGLTKVQLEAVDTRTGAVRWHHVLGDRTQAVAADSTNLYLSSGSTLRALDPATGAVRWRRDVPGGQLLASAGHVVVAGPTRTGRSITSYDAAGTRQWHTAGYSTAAFHIAATGTELVVAGQDGFVEASSLADGGYRWFTSFSTAVTTQPAIAGGVVYLTLATPRSTALYALRDGTGRVLWSYREPARGTDAYSAAAPSVAAGTLFASLGSGIVRAFRAS